MEDRGGRILKVFGTQILLNMKNITWAGFSMIPYGPEATGKGICPAGRISSWESRALLSCQRACPCLSVRVCPYILCSPPCSEQARVQGSTSHTETAWSPEMAPKAGSEAWFGFVWELFPLLWCLHWRGGLTAHSSQLVWLSLMVSHSRKEGALTQGARKSPGWSGLDWIEHLHLVK